MTDQPAGTTERAPRRRLTPEQRRTQLVGVALELLLAGPLDDLTVDAVAARAGVSKSLIFHYFPTVRDLHLSALEGAASILVAQLQEVQETSPPEEMLARGVDVFVSFIELQPGTYSALAARAAVDQDYGRVFQAVRSQAALLAVEGLGEETEGVGMYLLAGWVSFVDTVVQTWLADDRAVPRAEMIQGILDITEAFTPPN